MEKRAQFLRDCSEIGDVACSGPECVLRKKNATKSRYFGHFGIEIVESELSPGFAKLIAGDWCAHCECSCVDNASIEQLAQVLSRHQCIVDLRLNYVERGSSCAVQKKIVEVAEQSMPQIKHVSIENYTEIVPEAPEVSWPHLENFICKHIDCSLRFRPKSGRPLPLSSVKTKCVLQCGCYVAVRDKTSSLNHLDIVKSSLNDGFLQLECFPNLSDLTVSLYDGNSVSELLQRPRDVERLMRLDRVHINFIGGACIKKETLALCMKLATEFSLVIDPQRCNDAQLMSWFAELYEQAEFPRLSRVTVTTYDIQHMAIFLARIPGYHSDCEEVKALRQFHSDQPLHEYLPLVEADFGLIDFQLQGKTTHSVSSFRYEFTKSPQLALYCIVPRNIVSNADWSARTLSMLKKSKQLYKINVVVQQTSNRLKEEYCEMLQDLISTHTGIEECNVYAGDWIMNYGNLQNRANRTQWAKPCIVSRVMDAIARSTSIKRATINCALLVHRGSAEDWNELKNMIINSESLENVTLVDLPARILLPLIQSATYLRSRSAEKGDKESRKLTLTKIYKKNDYVSYCYCSANAALGFIGNAKVDQLISVA